MPSKHRGDSTSVATVEIDREAYQRLEAARSKGESISEVIKRCVRPKQSADEILATMHRAAISISTLDAIDESVSRRRRRPHKSKG